MLEREEEEALMELQQVQQEEKDAYREMEEALLLSSQSKRERISAGHVMTMNSTTSQIYSDGLPKINEKKGASYTPDAYGKAKHKKSKSMGRNTQG